MTTFNEEQLSDAKENAYRLGHNEGSLSVLHLLANVRPNQKIEAIKYVRQHTGAGLKEAKDLIEALMVSMHAMQTVYTPRSAPKGWASTGDVPEVTYLVTWCDDMSYMNRETFFIESSAIQRAQDIVVIEGNQDVQISRVTHKVATVRVPQITKL